MSEGPTALARAVGCISQKRLVNMTEGFDHDNTPIRGCPRFRVGFRGAMPLFNLPQFDPTLTRSTSSDPWKYRKPYRSFSIIPIITTSLTFYKEKANQYPVNVTKIAARLNSGMTPRLGSVDLTQAYQCGVIIYLCLTSRGLFC